MSYNMPTLSVKHFVIIMLAITGFVFLSGFVANLQPPKTLTVRMYNGQGEMVREWQGVTLVQGNSFWTKYGERVHIHGNWTAEETK